MKTLEIRRHSFRKQGAGSQLSQHGVDVARKLGVRMGPFDCVVTSVVPRTRETAIAMGFAVDFEVVAVEPSTLMYAELGVNKWWGQARPFEELASIIRQHGGTFRFAHATLAQWRDIVLQLPDQGRALLIGHSGELEPALVAGFPDEDHATWGKRFAPCEGARLYFGGDPERFVSLEFLREKI